MSATTIEQPEVAPATVEVPPTVEVDTRKLFAILTESWKNDKHVLVSSDPGAVLNNPAFQMIIALGVKVLPLIFEDFEREETEWSVALCSILGVTPAPPEHFGRISLVRKDWLAWGKAHGYL